MIIVLAQMLTTETSVLLRRIQPLLGGHTSFHVRHSLSFSQKVLNMALLSKEEVMKSITDSVVLSRDGSVAFVSNLGGIRAVSAGGETVERVENEVVCGTVR